MNLKPTKRTTEENNLFNLIINYMKETRIIENDYYLKLILN